MKTRTSTIHWLFIALVLLYAGFEMFRVAQQKPGPHAEQVGLIRRLAAAGDPSLAEVLEHSTVLVPAGEFRRGSDTGNFNEAPQQTIYLDAYEIDRFEVTNAQYSRFLQANGRPAPSYWNEGIYPNGQADHPVVGISWKDADAYCTWADKRLPTEAEWEKACRGTDAREYPWGDKWDPGRLNIWVPAEASTLVGEAGSPAAWAYAWGLLPSTPQAGAPGLMPVGSYPAGASPYGVMDMAGNASEWVFDFYNWAGYADIPTRNPVNLEPPWNHGVRGSAWYDPAGTISLVPSASRCSARSSAHSLSDPRIGFRCARSVSNGTR